jgi:hypothetical protein
VAETSSCSYGHRVHPPLMRSPAAAQSPTAAYARLENYEGGNQVTGDGR